jgi:hypothetical protein
VEALVVAALVVALIWLARPGSVHSQASALNPAHAT